MNDIYPKVVPRSFGTHDGSFHADEVTASALLLFFDLIDKDKIHRTRDPKVLSQCEIVCDVGGIYDNSTKRFDHHQVDYRGPLSSAGMILLYLQSEKILSQKDYDFLNNSLIRGVDAHDNGKEIAGPGVCTFSTVISNFMPVQYDADKNAQDKSFLEAVEFAYGHIKRLWLRHQYIDSCQDMVINAMKLYQDYLIFESAIPWMDSFFEQGGHEHPASFVIMPSGNNWKLRGIPPSMDDKMKVRIPLPHEWAGLLGNDLKRVSGINGAIFCHKGSFISVWETKEDAIKAVEMILNPNFRKNLSKKTEI